MIELFLSNNRIAVFLEQQQKNQITTITGRASRLLEAVAPSALGQIHFS